MVLGEQQEERNLLEKALEVHRAGKVQQAKPLYEQILRMHPQHAEVLRLLGTAEYQLGNLEECVMHLRGSLLILPNQAETQYNLAVALGNLKRYEDALTHYEKTIILKPDHAEAYYNRAQALIELGRLEEATEDYKQAIGINPKYFRAYLNLGLALKKLRRSEEALASYNRAIELKPNYAEAYYGKGNVLVDQYELQDALACYSKATQIDPQYAEAHFNKGSLLVELRRFEDALACYDRAVEIKPEFVEAHQNRGSVLIHLQRLQEAIDSYQAAVLIKPDADSILGDFLHFRRQLGIWHGDEMSHDDAVEIIRRNPHASSPFSILSLLDEPALHRRVAEASGAARYSAGRALSSVSIYPRRDKIRIGYFSSDFGNHPVTHLLAAVLEHHDRSRFEIFAFAFGAERNDPWRKRVIDAVDNFIDLGIQPAKEIAKIAREREIDIAIDLNGYTADAKTGIFAERAAPIQASYIGYVGTMGVPYIDYLIADRTVIPEKYQKFYSERIVYLSTFQCNDHKQHASTRTFERYDLGLPEEGFVFCSFNNVYKINPDVFDIWMRILKRVPKSILWLYAPYQTAIDNFKREAEARDVPSNRLFFAERLPLVDHLARQRAADLFLDTNPYNAGATASNALRVGLPVLTRAGKAFAARMGASLLQSVGVPELITYTDQDYENLAVELATQPHKYQFLKNKLAENLSTCELFDTERFTRNIEAAYTAMFERCQMGLAPDHIDVSSVR